MRNKKRENLSKQKEDLQQKEIDAHWFKMSHAAAPSWRQTTIGRPRASQAGERHSDSVLRRRGEEAGGEEEEETKG